MAMIAVVGAGNMGAAIVRGALRREVVSPQDLLVVDPDPARRGEMAALGCAVAADAARAREAPTILFAVKPQAFADVARALAPLPDTALAVSIMAGWESQAIREALGGVVRVVRAMPNTPCQLGEGMTAVALGAGAVPGDEATPMRIFAALGQVALIEEPLLHAATAVSGSGPAYAFALAEAMERAAVDAGFEPALARQFVLQTVAGAAALLRTPGADPAALRAAVTSKGGTTEAALRVLAEGGLDELVRRAVAAARDRAAQLGRASSRR